MVILILLVRLLLAHKKVGCRNGVAAPIGGPRVRVEALLRARVALGPYPEPLALLGLFNCVI